MKSIINYIYTSDFDKVSKGWSNRLTLPATSLPRGLFSNFLLPRKNLLTCLCGFVALCRIPPCSFQRTTEELMIYARCPWDLHKMPFLNYRLRRPLSRHLQRRQNIFIKDFPVFPQVYAPILIQLKYILHDNPIGSNNSYLI